ncbi:EAL domain-containing protein [Sulfurimonas sp.]
MVLKNKITRSITSKISMFMFFFSFILIISIVVVFLFVNKQELNDNAYNSAIINAHKVYAKLEQRKIRALTIAMSLANLGEKILSKQDEKNKTLIKNIIDLEGYEDFIAGGGIWPEPFSLDPSRERNSYFFGRNKEGELEFYNDYNIKSGAGYHNEEWYVPARFFEDGKAYWSKSYVDPYSFQPMVTVTVPMYKDDKFFGVSTVDIMLDGLHGFLEENMKSLGGYGFLLDRNNKFITYPDLKKISIKKRDITDTITFSEFVKKQVEYKDLYDVIGTINHKTIDENPYNPQTASYLDKNSYQIDEDESKHIATIIKSFENGLKFDNLEIRSQVIDNDPLIKDQSFAVALMQPDTHWKLVVVIPTSTILSQSNNIFKNLMVTVIIVVILLGLIAYLIIRKIIINPIYLMNTQLKNSLKTNELLSIDSKDEMGMLANIFNKRTQNLVDTQESLTELTKTLEEKVESRTKELKTQSDFLNLVINNVGSGIMVIDKEFNVTMMNNISQNMVDNNVIQNPTKPKCYEVSHKQSEPCSGINDPCPLVDVLENKKPVQCIHTHYDLDANESIVELIATPLFDEAGEVSGIVEITHDITELINTKKTLQHQAEHDSLTGLPNRDLFLDRLKQSIKHASRNKEKIAVLFLDLDLFKEINDTFGHAIGDELLVLIAKKLKSSIRESDTVARLGGDEFAIVIDEIKHIETAIDIIQKIIQSIGGPQALAQQEVYITFSIGISVFPDDSRDSDALLKYADTAMYKAKKDGRNNYQFYTNDMTQKALERITLEAKLRESIKKDEMNLHYQLQVDSNNNSILGMEALARWNNDDLGFIPPDKFIPLAEYTGFMFELGEWILERAISDWTKWRSAGLNPGILSVNLSRIRLKDKLLVEKTKAVLLKYGMNPSDLMLEITESQVMENPEKAILILKKLNEAGIKIAIDDFGTGYSSLSSLKQLPIDKLKIDRAFIMDLAENSDDKEICKTIISMAKGLNLNVIAEGVETEEQAKFLHENGCAEIQGYLYHKPVSRDEIKEKLKEYL